MTSSSASMFLMTDNALGMDPELLELLELLALLNEDPFVDAAHEWPPILLPSVDDSASTPGLITDDGSSQRYVGA